MPNVKLAVAGKGGAGKTTISATLARTLARRGRKVYAIDGDPNPNLGVALGIPTSAIESVVRVPRGLTEAEKDSTGKTRMVLKESLEVVRDRHAITGPDGVRLMLITGVGHAGEG